MRPTATTPGYGDWLDEQDLNYVMAVSCDARFTTPTGPRRADELAASGPKRGWQRPLGRRRRQRAPAYDWLLIDPSADQHLLLVRRSISKPSELVYYLCRSSTPEQRRWVRYSLSGRIPSAATTDL